MNSENLEWSKITPVAPHLLLSITHQLVKCKDLNKDCHDSAHAVANQKKLARPVNEAAVVGLHE